MRLGCASGGCGKNGMEQKWQNMRDCALSLRNLSQSWCCLFLGRSPQFEQLQLEVNKKNPSSLELLALLYM